MTKKISGILFSLFVVLFLAFGMLAAFMQTCYAQEQPPLVETIAPDTVFAGRESVVVVNGENLPEIFTVTLVGSRDFVLQLQTSQVSSTELQVYIPANVAIGNYRLQIDFGMFVDRFAFSVIASEPSITFVTPLEFWNRDNTTLQVQGSGFSMIPLVMLGSTQITNVQAISDSLLTVQIPASFTPGQHDLTLYFGGGTSLHYPDKVIVRHYVKPHVSNVEPREVYNNVARRVQITGEGLGNLSEFFLGNTLTPLKKGGARHEIWYNIPILSN